jgi:ABC-type bacteriocin/lantibiotic exporter with double-glycine peptidase domain
MKTLRFLFSHLGRFGLAFWLLLLAGGLDGIANFAVPVLLSEFTREHSPALELTRTVIPLLAACLCMTLALQWCLRRWAEALCSWFGNNLRAHLFRDVEALQIETLSEYHSGYIAALINQVAGSVGSLTTSILWLVGHLITTLSLFLFFTARESIALAFSNLCLLIIFVGVSIILSRRMVPLADQVNKTSAVAAERSIDFLTNISTVKKLGIASWAESRIRAELALNNQAVSKLQLFHANRWAILHSIFFTSLLATIAILLTRIERHDISPAILILFIAGFSTIRGHAERLAELIKTLLETDAYVTRLLAITAAKAPRGSQPLPLLEEITLHAISFSYKDSHHQVRVPHWTIAAGDRILITGQSGQGKSTLLAILTHQRVPTHGECLWNGVPYQEYGTALAQSFALASQEAELFNLSLRENLNMGSAVSDKEICTLLCDLGLSQLLETLPAGLNTPVGEKGLKLSTGQKQRIAIARAILLRRPVLLLDEPTSHLDSASEQDVLKCLRTISPKTTIIIISHEPIFRSFCKRELVMEGGTLRDA